MRKTITLLSGLLFLCTVGCTRKQTVDFAKELSGKIPVGTSQGDAEKVLDQYGFTHSFDLRTRTIYAIKHDQGSGFIKLDWSATININEGQKVESLSVKKIFTGP
jgi:hypothetical protein